MSKRIRDAIQHQGIGPKKPRRTETSTGRSVVTVAGEEEEQSSCRAVRAMAPSTTDAACSTSGATGNNNGLTATVITDDKDISVRWRRLLWICGMRVEDLVLGWFPFSEEDFVGQTCWEDDDHAAFDGHLFDDIWQIKHIQEIPTVNSTKM